MYARGSYDELQEKMAQRIFGIGFVKKAHFTMGDCRYMVRSFFDLAEPRLTINSDLYEACELAERAWAGDGVDMATAVDACLLAITKAGGG